MILVPCVDICTFEEAVSSRLYGFAFAWKDLHPSTHHDILDRSSDNIHKKARIDVGVKLGEAATQGVTGWALTEWTC